MTDQDKREQHALYFYEAILSEAVFECILEEWENIETDKGTALKKELDTDNLNSENEEDNMMILQEWKYRECDKIAEEQQRKTGIVITKIYQQKIAENPFKHAEGYVYKNPVKEQIANDNTKKKREIRREEKRRMKRAEEEEKRIKKQFKIIDTMMESYSREVKVQWKRELKREKMTKMDRRERRKLEKGVKTKENEKVQVEMKKNPQNADKTKERPNDLSKKGYIRKESEKEEEKKADFYRQSKKHQHGEIKILINDIDIEKKETQINDIDIEKKEEKKETQTDINVNVKVDEQKSEEKKKVTGRIRSFFMSLCCNKGQ
ncbi:unnamed protein product [Mytilus coruscus]|uniref:Uncharacterized protein n=1 Tax=Mytilus coruscus TaxID=42192 RepID=A0A6J8E468_MYTCO|nr:unnamed protein product [Mytilus coruscus]